MSCIPQTFGISNLTRFNAKPLLLNNLKSLY